MNHRGLRFQFVWSDVACDKLRELWADGFSCSQIADAMHALFGGKVTRNTVIGKVHRLGLEGRAKSPSSSAPRQRKARATRSTPFRRGNAAPALAYDYEIDAEPEVLDNIIPFGQRCTILELTDETCRWPIGDPATDLFFCGGQPVIGLPYCGYHGRIAYRPAPDRRRERAPREAVA